MIAYDPLEAIRLIAGDMLANNPTSGTAAVLLALVANAERQMAAARLEERAGVVAYLRLVLGGQVGDAFADQIERGAHLAAPIEPRQPWSEMPD